MALVPALDLRQQPTSADPRDEQQRLPANIEAEQALLGCLLYDAEAMGQIGDELKPEHFFEPFHGRLFRAIARSVQIGVSVDPTAIAEQLRSSAAFQELGGVRYLADLIDRAPLAAKASTFARIIVDLGLRRDLVRTAQQLVHDATTTFEDEDGKAVEARGLAERLQADLTAIQLRSTKHELVELSDAAAGVVNYITQESKTVGVSTGVGKLDLALGPLLPGDLVLCGGRPRMGKSALAGAFSLGVGAPRIANVLTGTPFDGREPHGVIEVHGEMTFGDEKDGGQVARRHISNLGFAKYGDDFPTYRDLRERRHMTPRRVEMVAEIAASFRGWPIKGYKRTGLTIGALRAIVRVQAAAWARDGIKLGLVIVDHVGLMRVERRTSGRYEAQTEIAIGLKELADELGVPILALVQLSRQLESRDDKRPNIADLRDTGAWEENADAVVFVHRDSVYAHAEPDPKQGVKDFDAKVAALEERRRSPSMNAIVAKMREGAERDVELWCDLPHNAIRGISPKEGLAL